MPWVHLPVQPAGLPSSSLHVLLTLCGPAEGPFFPEAPLTSPIPIPLFTFLQHMSGYAPCTRIKSQPLSLAFRASPAPPTLLALGGYAQPGHQLWPHSSPPWPGWGSPLPPSSLVTLSTWCHRSELVLRAPKVVSQSWAPSLCSPTGCWAARANEAWGSFGIIDNTSPRCPAKAPLAQYKHPLGPRNQEACKACLCYKQGCYPFHTQGDGGLNRPTPRAWLRALCLHQPHVLFHQEALLAFTALAAKGAVVMGASPRRKHTHQ